MLTSSDERFATQAIARQRLFLVLMWPRRIILYDGVHRVRGLLDRFLREKGLSIAVLIFFYL